MKKFIYFKKHLTLSILLIIFCSSNAFIAINSEFRDNYQNDIFEKPISAGEIYSDQPWLDNSEFDTEDYWYSEESIIDNTDVDSDITGGVANYKVVGENHIITIAETELSSSNWTESMNPDYPIYPNVAHGYDNGDMYVSHFWIENDNETNNIASSQWKRNVTLPLIMSNYIITDVSINVTINATVQAESVGNGGIDRPGDAQLGDSGVYDNAKFYLRISDLAATNIFEFAQNETKNCELGSDKGFVWDYLYDTGMIVVSKGILIAYLNQIFSVGDYQNLTLTFGIDMLSEDNKAVEQDNWADLRIKEYNITIMCEKKITQQTTVSWNQDASRTPSSIIIRNASLAFDYMIDQMWPSSSINSVIEVSINGDTISDTINLYFEGETFWQNKQIDVTSFIRADSDVNLSIKVYLGDEFNLANNITVSIDNVYLNISYETTVDPFYTSYKIYLNGNESTSQPTITVALNTTLNITVKYINNSNGANILGATVKLNRLGTPESPDEEDLIHGQYEFYVDVDTELLRGINPLGLTMFKIDYQSQTASPSPSVSVRPRNTTITSETGSTTIDTFPGGNATMILKLFDEDSKETIKNVTVQFDGGILGTGFMVDKDKDGIYNYSIENCVEGFHPIEINIIASDIYDFDNFQLYINSSKDLLNKTEFVLLINGDDYTSSPILDIPIGSDLNITVKYLNSSFSHIIDADIKLSRLGFTDDFEEDKIYGQYELILDVDNDLQKGLNSLILTARKNGYTTNTSNIELTIRKIETSISSEGGSIINVFPEANVTLKIRLQDIDNSVTIKNMTVTYTSNLDSGLLIDNDEDGVYEAKIEYIPEGSHVFYISVAINENYSFDPIQVTINGLSSLLIPTKIQVLMNDIDLTTDPTLDLPIGSILNITIKYTNDTYEYIPNAIIELDRLGYTDIFIENSIYHQYSILLDVDNDLLRGLNLLEIRAKKAGYQQKINLPRITVRKIQTKISTLTGLNSIDIKPKDDVTIRIKLEDLDNNNTIRNVTVTYSWQFGTGDMEDLDNDGIYEIKFDKVPESSYKIIIKVYANDSFEFATYELTLNALRTPQEIMTQNVILIITIFGTVAFGGYMFIYQTRLKYPAEIRKLRNLRKSISRRSTVKQSVDVPSRNELIEEIMDENMSILGSKTLKSIKKTDYSSNQPNNSGKTISKDSQKKIDRDTKEIEPKNVDLNEKLKSEREAIRKTKLEEKNNEKPKKNKKMRNKEKTEKSISESDKKEGK